jgi:2-keto-3-deoxy-L-rhamnonate aldolase RhmA
MSSDIGDAMVRYHRLSSDTCDIQRVLDSGLKTLVVSAVNGTDDLSRSVVSLFDDSTPAKTSLIAKCKG